MRSVIGWYAILPLALAACGGGGGTGGTGGGGGASGGTGGSENHPPYLDIIGNRDITVGQLLQFEVAATDADAGDTLTFIADGTVGPNDDPFSAASAASFDPGTRIFSWTPGSDDIGLYSVLFRVTDDGEPQMTSSQTITITVTANHEPVLHITDFGTPETAIIIGTVGHELRRNSGVEGYVVWGTDEDTADTLTVTVDATAGPFANPLVANTPLVWSGATGLFTWDPALPDAGCYSLEFTVSDDGTPLMTDSAQVTIVVEPNFAPFFVDPELSLTISAGKPFTEIYLARDNNEPDSISLTHGPTGSPGAANDPFITNGALGLDFATFTAGIFSWTPQAANMGPYEFWIEVTEDTAFGWSSTIIVSVEVVANVAPSIAPIGDRVVEVGTELSFVVEATDIDAGDTVVLSHDGAVGPGADPFAATLPATFDDATGQFAWTPAATGDFNVRFTATDGVDPASVTIAIQVVDAATNDGAVIINEVTYEAPGAQVIELANIDTHSIDLAGWELCGGGTCASLPSVVLSPGGDRIALVAWDHTDVAADISANQTSMGSNPCESNWSVALYNTAGQAGGAAAIRSFVQWLATGQPGETDALGAAPRKWRTGDRVEAGTGSICFTGTDPARADSFLYDSTPTPGAENEGCL